MIVGVYHAGKWTHVNVMLLHQWVRTFPCLILGLSTFINFYFSDSHFKWQFNSRISFFNLSNDKTCPNSEVQVVTCGSPSRSVYNTLSFVKQTTETKQRMKSNCETKTKCKTQLFIFKMKNVYDQAAWASVLTCHSVIWQWPCKIGLASESPWPVRLKCGARNKCTQPFSFD